MTTATEQRIARREPLLEQVDLGSFRADACRIIDRLGAPFYCRRDLTRGELAILDLAYSIEDLIQGELGEDGDGDPEGNLTVEKRAPTDPAVYQLVLDGNENGAKPRRRHRRVPRQFSLVDENGR